MIPPASPIILPRCGRRLGLVAAILTLSLRLGDARATIDHDNVSLRGGTGAGSPSHQAPDGEPPTVDAGGGIVVLAPPVDVLRDDRDHRRRRRVAASCTDIHHTFEYDKDGKVVDATCQNIANTSTNNNNKRARKCARVLAANWASMIGNRKRTVADVCPDTCDACGDSQEAVTATTVTAAAAAAAATTTTTSAALPQQAQLRQYALGAHVVKRVDSDGNGDGTDCPLPSNYDSATAVTTIVTNREIYIGCHSWETYFSPKFRTIFIINERVADEWNLEKLVNNVPCSKSLGATLLKLDNFGGELQGRKLGLDLIESEHVDTKYMMQMNCDVHAIPSSHNYYRSVEESVLKSAKDLRMANLQREDDLDDIRSNEGVPRLKNTNFVENFSDDSCGDNPVFGMSFILVEDFADDDDLVQKFHGVDGCKWQQKDGPNGRSNSYSDDHPWLCSGDKWENHALMFDVAKLVSVRKFYIDDPVSRGVQTFPSDTRFGPRFAREYGYCMVTHRDVHFHQDFAIEEHLTDYDYPLTLDQYPDSVDKDTMRVLSIASLCETRGPKNPYYLYQAYTSEENGMGLEPYIGGTGYKFYNRHVASEDSPWMPDDIEGAPLTDTLAETLLDGNMKLFGYERFTSGCGHQNYCYRIEGVYPGNNYVMATDRPVNCQDGSCWEFFRIDTPGNNNNDSIRLTAVSEITYDEIREMRSEDRIIEIPAAGSTVRTFRGPYAIEGQPANIADKGVNRREGSKPCPEDQDEDRSCGYQNTPEFDHPY